MPKDELENSADPRTEEKHPLQVAREQNESTVHEDASPPDGGYDSGRAHAC